jgi:16S rRNA (guanine527-N7)-methyltransferase
VNRVAFLEAARAIGLSPTESQLDQLDEFENRLYAANEVMNLTRVPREEAWLRHFLDSLLCHDLVPVGATVLDLGTGPGLPAWPLACMRPDLQISALDSAAKMIGFLKGNPLPNLEPVLGRAEGWGVKEQFDVVTGRAVAPLGIQLEISAPPCKVGGMVLAMRTPAEEDQVRGFEGDGLGLKLEQVVFRPLPDTDVVRLFPVYRKVSKTDRQYPRNWAEIKRQPVF